MCVINLDEIEVTAKRIENKDPFYEPRLRFWANHSSNETITRDKIEKVHLRSLIELVALLAKGAKIAYNRYGAIMGITFYRTGGLAELYIDGIRRDWGDGITPDEIESIDIFNGPSSVAFGMKGANGVVSVTTRRGGDKGIEFEKYNYDVYTPLGFQQPIEFYAPKYETIEARQSPMPDLRTTIYWKPDVVISAENDEATFEFYTSDFPTTYSLVIEGLTTDGLIVRQVEKIRVE